MEGPHIVQHLFRTYVLYLIDTRLMPNYTDNLVHLKWWPFLVKSPREVGQYIWGSACLTTIYRSLFDAAIYGANEVPECTILLHAWAW